MLRYAQLFAKAQFCRVRICVWSDWNGPVPLLMESGIYSDGENVFMTQCGSPFNPQMSVYRVWMNRKQQIKCVVGITIRKSIFHMPFAPYSVIRGVGSLQLHLLWPSLLGSQSWLLESQDWSLSLMLLFPALPGPVSVLTSSSAGASPSLFLPV